MGGMPLGFTLGPEDLLLDDDGNPMRIDKAYSWEAPIAAHGLMHMVIANAWKGDPYKIDTLFMYMANMAWNSSMNSAETARMLTDKDADGSYRIPHIIYSDAFYSETVAYSDLILPDTTYLERWDCISLLDRPICSAEGPGDAIRQPVVAPDRDVRPFQDVLIDLAVRLKLPGFTNADGTPRNSPAAMRTISSTTSASPASARLPGSAAPTARSRASANPTRASSTAISRTAPSGAIISSPTSSTSSMRTRAISRRR